MKNIILYIFSLLLIVTNLQAQGNDNYTFTDINGKVYHAQGTKDGVMISETKNKIVFLEFFGHNCPPCLASIPHYNATQAKYGKNVQVIAFEVQGYDNNQLKQFANAKGINYSTVSGKQSGNFVDYIASRANWNGLIPYVVIVDKKGVVQYMQAGMLGQAQIDSIIKELSK